MRLFGAAASALTQLKLWRLKCYKGKLLSNISGVTHLQ